MAVIIYGTRNYGLVDEHEGELAQSTFFHVWFLPLFPVGSTWITQKGMDDDLRGHKIKLHGKSILAGYLRVWGPLVAIGNFVASWDKGSVAHFAVALAAIALCAVSWTWRSLRGDRAKRRSDFNYVAFGTRVEPKRLDAETRAQLKAALDRQWNARAPKGSPNDVARHGTTDPGEAVLAYGLLRLAAIERGGKGEENADADRILDGDHVPNTESGGPYRAGIPTAAAPTTALGELVAARLAAAEEGHQRTPTNEAAQKAAARKRRRRYRIGLGVATVFALSGAMMFSQAVRPPLDVTITQLRSVKPPTSRQVNVTCDKVVGPLWQETSADDGHAINQIVMCELGPYHLAVKLDDDQPVPTKVVHGKLRDIPDQAIWVTQGLRTEPEIEAATLDVFIDGQASRHRAFEMALGLLFVVGAPVLFLLYFTWTRRNRELLA